MDFEIRGATPDDATRLTALARRAKSHWGYPADWIERWKPDLTLTPAYLAAHRGFVAERDTALLGVCVLESRPDGCSLEHVWIEPESQRRGIGRRLVNAALDAARGIGAARIALVADPFAEPFYLALGARPVGSVPAPMPGAPDRTLPALVFDL